MRGERKNLYRRATQVEKNFQPMPWIDSDDMRTSQGKDGEWDAIPEEPIYTDYTPTEEDAE